MRLYNSTIKVKEKICVSCGKPCIWFSRKRCKQCATIERVLADSDKEVIEDEDLQTLISDADTLFSRWLRLSNADKNGEVKCYTCDAKIKVSEAQCGHFVKRGNLFLRFDSRNCRVQCKTCNEYKHGNMGVYARKLEEEHPGITEILLEESRIVYKPTRHELKQLVAELTEKIKLLKQ